MIRREARLQSETGDAANVSEERKRIVRRTARRWYSAIRPRAPTAPSACAASCIGPTRTCITSIRTSTTTRPTGRRTTTGPGREIVQQTGGRLTHFVAAMGTSGTFMGVTRRLRRDLPHVDATPRKPSSGFHGLEGLEAHATASSGHLRRETGHGNLWIETEDAYRMVRRLAREEGCWWESRRAATCMPRTVLAAGWRSASSRP